MLVNLKEVLKIAQNENIAIGSFNIYNLETILALKEAVLKTKKPVIVAFGENYINYVPMKVISDSVKTIFNNIDIPIVLHLDHAKNIETIKKAIDYGFTSVMYDGSKLSLKENIINTKKVIEIAHKKNISVEGELGYLNNEDGTGKIILKYTNEIEAKKYVENTKVDALAIAIGNAHGIYMTKPSLNFKQLEILNKIVTCPLVLHGSSGIQKNDLQKAIDLGIRKFNINTEVSNTGVKTIREYLLKYPENKKLNLRLETVLEEAHKQMTEKIINYINIFNKK